MSVPFITEVACELEEILENPEEPISQERAYGAVANIFEEIYQGVVDEAIEALTSDRRVRLLTMAALGAPEHAMYSDWIMRKLVKSGDLQALPAFLHVAVKNITKTSHPQDTVAGFVWAVRGCARYLEAPPIAQPQTDVERVWEAYRAVLFWMYKPGITNSERREASLPWWERMRTLWPFEAVDPLLQLDSAAWMNIEDFQPLSDLCSMFPGEVRWLLEFGLNNRSRLTTMFGSWPIRQDELASIIRWLAVVGNRRTIRLLEPLVDTPDLGPYAVEAVRKLKDASSG
jgi:hypothetical protein